VRVSPTLLELEEARQLVLRTVSTLPSEPVPLAEALGRHLAEEVCSTEPVPAFDNSAMDGFALRAADTRAASPATPASLCLVGESRAGSPATRRLGQQEAMRISTGAAIPQGADAVLRVEAARLDSGQVVIEEPVGTGRDVRFAGDDLEPGSVTLLKGARLGPAELGVLASVGLGQVSCHRRPRVAVLTSGDELIGPDEASRAGAVRNSNAYSVPALAELAGAEVIRADPVPDRPEATRRALEPLLEADVVVVCGGVSVGDHDHVKGAFAGLGVQELFWGVALRPGRPTWFGVSGTTLVFGLPGNPVSAMVTFLLLVRPALVLMGGGDPTAPRLEVKLAADYEKAPGRTHAVRSRLELRDDGWWAHPFERQGSHVLTSMLGADCLVLVPSATGTAQAGRRFEAEVLQLGWKQ
jgi:molybdopterin molybdotransferase